MFILKVLGSSNLNISLTSITYIEYSGVEYMVNYQLFRLTYTTSEYCGLIIKFFQKDYKKQIMKHYVIVSNFLNFGNICNFHKMKIYYMKCVSACCFQHFLIFEFFIIIFMLFLSFIRKVMKWVEISPIAFLTFPGEFGSQNYERHYCPLALLSANCC